ncbi:MAG: cysteinyl-tRNA synthetase [Frankiaceae bacterium]|nr:cysteinyl-tRNA synthetase [Frankiaceae bacterium]
MLRLTDTMTRRHEDIAPSRDRLLTLYACGPTVYRSQHVGNLRTFVLGDLIARTGEVLHGWRTKLVQNITDVGHLADDTGIELAGEDKMLLAAREQNRDPFEIARHYEAEFRTDCSRLNIHPADHYPRASECIDLMIELIAKLIETDHAYVGDDGSVYFAAQSFPSYGALSGNRLEDLRAGHRQDAGELSAGKRFHADWALWKHAGSQRQMVWESPWGKGFPGWHIECSAMSLHFLGDTFDVHTAGVDLRFPHHEDERAQSESAVGHEVVRRWVHGEHLLADGRKMAKSTGNVVLVDDVVARGYDALAVRLFFLTGRYRQQMNLTWDALAGADRRLGRWRSRVAEWAEAPSAPMHAETVARFTAAFDDDLDTPSALVALGELEKNDGVAPGAKFETFAWADRLLGLDLVRDVGRPRNDAADLSDDARALLDARAAAREAKDWAMSDRLRDQLAGLGVAVVDGPGGQSWSRTGGTHE